MKKILAVLTAISMSLQMQAQDDVDALRHSQLTFGGTARGMGLSGAFGALGADFTSLSINPAGIGLYRSSEIMFTPAILSSFTESGFYNSGNNDRKYNFNFTNWGFVMTELQKKKNDDENQKPGWVSYSFAFGANRLANYHNRTFFQGYNPANSLLDKYLEELNAGSGTPVSQLDDKSAFPFGAALAYWAYLVNPVTPADTTQEASYYTSVIPNGNIRQSGTITTKGAMDEYVISFGANYNNKLYIGGTLGLPYLRYIQEYDYSETDIHDSVPDFNSFALSDYMKRTGMGANLKFGLIYKPSEWVRLGGAVHTPTYFSLRDDYSTKITSEFATAKPSIDETNLTSDGSFEYGLTTPWRLIGSMALVYKKVGFLTVDYEWLDYRQAFFNFNRADGEDKFEGKEINQDILNKYTAASNIRIGAEVSYDMFRFRGGYGLYGTPFKSGVAEGSADNSRQSISFGLGVREEDYFIDFGFVRTMTKESYLPYKLSYETPDIVTKNIAQNNFLVTMGVKF